MTVPLNLATGCARCSSWFWQIATVILASRRDPAVEHHLGAWIGLREGAKWATYSLASGRFVCADAVSRL